MYTSIILVCDSHNLTTSEYCEPLCRNETACCTTIGGNITHNTTHECLAFNGEGEITRCEPGMFLSDKLTKENDITVMRNTSHLLYFSMLPEDPDPGSGSDCLTADVFNMRGTELFFLHRVISDMP